MSDRLGEQLCNTLTCTPRLGRATHWISCRCLLPPKSNKSHLPPQILHLHVLAYRSERNVGVSASRPTRHHKDRAAMDVRGMNVKSFIIVDINWVFISRHLKDAQHLDNSGSHRYFVSCSYVVLCCIRGADPVWHELLLTHTHSHLHHNQITLKVPILKEGGLNDHRAFVSSIFA